MQNQLVITQWGKVALQHDLEKLITLCIRLCAISTVRAWLANEDVSNSELFPIQHFTSINSPTVLAPLSIQSFYRKRPKPAATTASTPPVTSTLSATAAPVPVALAALPLALPVPEAAEPEAALVGRVVLIMLDSEVVLLATIRVVVP